MFKWCSVDTKRTVPIKYPPLHQTTRSLNCWCKARWILAFMLHLTLTIIQILKWTLVRLKVWPACIQRFSSASGIIFTSSIMSCNKWFLGFFLSPVSWDVCGQSYSLRWKPVHHPSLGAEMRLFLNRCVCGLLHTPSSKRDFEMFSGNRLMCCKAVLDLLKIVIYCRYWYFTVTA